MSELSLYFNPRCSKCRTAQGLLDERDIDAHVIEYLKVPPTVPELRVLMGKLGITDPRQMMRDRGGGLRHVGAEGGVG
jgi:arsenate reductase